MHIPVLLRESLEFLQVRSGGRYIDGTVGLGGHAEAILQRSAPNGKLLGLEVDQTSAQRAVERLKPFEDRFVIVNESYTNMRDVAQTYGFVPADGVLLDLGLSSWQLEESGRGFSFQAHEPLDMRYDPSRQQITAADIVNQSSEEELAHVLKAYGEEPRSRRLARRIVRNRPIATADQLAQVVAEAVGKAGGRTHPATRTFQALRIAVNSELENLEQGLQQVPSILAGGGRMVILSYHSLEDRTVKDYLRRESRDCICPPRTPVCMCGHTATLRVVTPRAVRPSVAEVQANPRSRSARLRAAERL
jgi:16S rRNA (cytosine1402-N4)-methyltransferase